jgi:hypothetical protein
MIGFQMDRSKALIVEQKELTMFVKYCAKL